MLGQPASPEGRTLLARAGPRGRLAPRHQAGSAWFGDRPDRAAAGGGGPLPTRPGMLAGALWPRGTVNPSPVADRIRRLYADRWPTAELRSSRFGSGTADASPSTVPSTAAPTAAPRTPRRRRSTWRRRRPRPVRSLAICRPVEVGGEAYIDGGVHSPTNADLLAGRDLDLVIVSAPMGIGGAALRPPGARSLPRPGTAVDVAVGRAGRGTGAAPGRHRRDHRPARARRVSRDGSGRARPGPDA